MPDSFLWVSIHSISYPEACKLHISTVHNDNSTVNLSRDIFISLLKLGARLNYLIFVVFLVQVFWLYSQRSWWRRDQKADLTVRQKPHIICIYWHSHWVCLGAGHPLLNHTTSLETSAWWGKVHSHLSISWKMMKAQFIWLWTRENHLKDESEEHENELIFTLIIMEFQELSFFLNAEQGV